eukprot:m.87216 g.87216  ORF g.87216 m.87216 type:complete len:95 (-) comp21384_c0_seq4:295-579(-)
MLACVHGCEVHRTCCLCAGVWGGCGVCGGGTRTCVCTSTPLMFNSALVTNLINSFDATSWRHHLVETVHVELAHKTGEIAVLEVLWQDFKSKVS